MQHPIGQLVHRRTYCIGRINNADIDGQIMLDELCNAEHDHAHRSRRVNGLHDFLRGRYTNRVCQRNQLYNPIGQLVRRCTHCTPGQHQFREFMRN